MTKKRALIFPNPFGEGPKIAVVAIAAFFLVTHPGLNLLISL